MAGLDAGLGAGLETGAGQAYLSSRRQFATVAWLRWRIFVNALRGKGAKGELVAKILSYPLLGLMILGPAVGSAVGAWYFVSNGQVRLLAILLWIVFGLWQFIGMNTSATGPTFDLATLIRFPLRYRDYFLIRMAFGLMDPPTLSGVACLMAMCLGIGIADWRLLLWAAPVLAVFAACNLFFSRMLYSWLERWLAQRRTRELVTVLLVALSLGVQFLAQFAQKLGHGRHGAPANPWVKATAHFTVSANWLLPPGLSAAVLDRIHRGDAPTALAAFAGLLAYTGLFLLILHLRLYAQFRGEDLSEAPAAGKRKPATLRAQTQAAAAMDSRGPLRLLPAGVAACLVKEVRYLLRSGPRMLVLFMPVFIVFLFSVRGSGMEYSGLAHRGIQGMLFTYGCAYTQLIFVGLIYNSLGSDGAGVQFYFLAPLRMRDVMLAKNLLIFAIFLIEVVLIYFAAAFIAAPAPLDLTVATLLWGFFTLFLNTGIGNVRSLAAPKWTDPMKMRSQNVSGLNSLISLVVVAVAVGLGALVLALCRWFEGSDWVAAAVFAVLTPCSFLVYRLILERIDGVAARHAENLARELCKA